MRSTSPKKKGGGATNATRSESCSILWQSGYSVNHVLAQWRTEANRLRAEYDRTGNPAHLKAFKIHRAAMQTRAGEVRQ
jgi:hypothetical protein